MANRYTRIFDAGYFFSIFKIFFSEKSSQISLFSKVSSQGVVEDHPSDLGLAGSAQTTARLGRRAGKALPCKSQAVAKAALASDLITASKSLPGMLS